MYHAIANAVIHSHRILSLNTTDERVSSCPDVRKGFAHQFAYLRSPVFLGAGGSGLRSAISMYFKTGDSFNRTNLVFAQNLYPKYKANTIGMLM